MPVKGQSTPVLDRVATKYTVNPSTQCWEWTGARSSQYRYPLIGRADGQRNHPQYVYKLLWMEKYGPMPTEEPPDGSFRWEHHHICENKACVNPDHVILVTHKEHTAIHKAMRVVARAQERQNPLPPKMPPMSVPQLPVEVVA